MNVTHVFRGITKLTDLASGDGVWIDFEESGSVIQVALSRHQVSELTYLLQAWLDERKRVAASHI